MKKHITSSQKALNLWAIILIVWSVYRAKFRMPEYIDEFIAKPLVFVLPVYYYIRKIERKEFFPSIYFDLKHKKLLKDLVFGLTAGGVFVVSAVLANSIKMGKITFLSGQMIDSQSLMVIFLTAIATSVSEEILSRGFILKRLYEESKNIYTASFLGSILFFFLHVPILFTNIRITGNLLLLFIATDMVLSLVNSFVFLERKSLTLPILIHAFYNLTLVFFI
jgi:membrane protease YdiL (CAAX protease family)